MNNIYIINGMVGKKHTTLNYSRDIVFVFVFCICIYGGWQKRTALNRSHNSLLQAAWEV